jgi:hypothetical protein
LVPNLFPVFCWTLLPAAAALAAGPAPGRWARSGSASPRRHRRRFIFWLECLFWGWLCWSLTHVAWPTTSDLGRTPKPCQCWRQHRRCLVNVAIFFCVCWWVACAGSERRRSISARKKGGPARCLFPSRLRFLRGVDGRAVFGLLAGWHWVWV